MIRKTWRKGRQSLSRSFTRKCLLGHERRGGEGIPCAAFCASNQPCSQVCIRRCQAHRGCRQPFCRLRKRPRLGHRLHGLFLKQSSAWNPPINGGARSSRACAWLAISPSVSGWSRLSASIDILTLRATVRSDASVRAVSPSRNWNKQLFELLVKINHSGSDL